MHVLVTGGAGFIGSNLVERLLKDSRVSAVKVLDNLSSGSEDNIKEFLIDKRFAFINGDIRDYEICKKACEETDIIAHQAALDSVALSLSDPLLVNEVNITGTLNIFTAAKELKIKRIVYAGSSATYGDNTSLPKVEAKIGAPLSPYSVTKYVNELYAAVYAKSYGLASIGLRYFNIFGPKQNINGAYAAVIPLFIRALLENQSPMINGDGSYSRDFTFISNAVEAIMLALFTEDKNALNQVYNIAGGEQMSLNDVFKILRDAAGVETEPQYGTGRAGDVLHVLADISKAANYLGYKPVVSIKQGLQETFDWYKTNRHFLT